MQFTKHIFNSPFQDFSQDNLTIKKTEMYPSPSVQADSSTYHFPNQLTDRCYKPARGDQLFYPDFAGVSHQQGHNQLNAFQNLNHANGFNALSTHAKAKKDSSEKTNGFDFPNGFAHQPSFCYGPGAYGGHQNLVFGPADLQQPYQPAHQPQATVHHKNDHLMDGGLYKRDKGIGPSKCPPSSAPYYWMVKHQKG